MKTYKFLVIYTGVAKNGSGIGRFPYNGPIDLLAFDSKLEDIIGMENYLKTKNNLVSVTITNIIEMR